MLDTHLTISELLRVCQQAVDKLCWHWLFFQDVDKLGSICWQLLTSLLAIISDLLRGYSCNSDTDLL